MQKQTKNELTRELLEKELRFYNTADIRSTLLWGGILALFFVPITIGFVRWIPSQVNSAFLAAVLCIAGGVLASYPVWVYVLSLARSLRERKMLSGGDFDVTVRALSYKSEKMVNQHLREYLHFEGFKAISVPHVMFQMASVDDEYYIVYYRTKNIIKLLYPTKIYEYKEK